MRINTGFSDKSGRIIHRKSHQSCRLFWKTFNYFVFGFPGLKDEEKSSAGNDELVEGLMQTILDIRKEAKLKKDWPTADKIREHLTSLNIEVKDTKDGAVWGMKE